MLQVSLDFSCAFNSVGEMTSILLKHIPSFGAPKSPTGVQLGGDLVTVKVILWIGHNSTNIDNYELHNSSNQISAFVLFRHLFFSVF